MIRFICREVDTGAAQHVGGPVDVSHRTFTDPAALESWLRYGDWKPENRARATAYNRREVLGVELEPEVTE